ncbi:MAG: hypothetical protein ACNA7O_04725 [Rhodobacterales bacterium]
MRTGSIHPDDLRVEDSADASGGDIWRKKKRGARGALALAIRAGHAYLGGIKGEEAEF